MIERIQKATASSPEGARGLIKGVLACAAQNVAFMRPTSLLYFLVSDLMAGTTSGRTAFYVRLHRVLRADLPDHMVPV